MKRIILLMAIAMLLPASAIKAQKVNDAAVATKLQRLEADSQDAKRGARPATWINLGNAYIEAANAYTQGLYKTQDINEVVSLYGQGEQGMGSIGDIQYEVLSYPNVDLYFTDGRLVIWSPKKEITHNALAKAGNSFLKAWEIDQSPANKTKVLDGQGAVLDNYKQEAENFYVAQSYDKAAQMFAAAADLSEKEPYAKTDTASIYNAGFLYTIGQNFPMGERYLRRALDYGYTNDGETYYYLFHTYFGREDYENAKKILLEGIAKYPTNNTIIESLLGLYAKTGEDPQEITPIVQAAIASDPSDPELYAGMGRIYDKMGKSEDAIKAFEKAIELAPNEFNYTFNLGLMIIKGADAYAAVLRDKPVTSRAAFDADLATLNGMYEKSLPALEKAHEINPEDAGTIELLKTVYFRLREMNDGYQTKYDYYNGLFENL